MLFLSTFVCAGGSVAFLFKGSERGDRLAVPAAELSVLFGVCVLIVGAAVGPQGVGRLVAVGRAADQLAAAVPDDGRLPDRAALRRPGRPQAVGGAGAVRGRSTCRWSTRASTSGGPFTRRPRWSRSWIPRMRPAFWSAFVLITLVWALLLTIRVRLEARAPSWQTLRLDTERPRGGEPMKTRARQPEGDPKSGARRCRAGGVLGGGAGPAIREGREHPEAGDPGGPLRRDRATASSGWRCSPMSSSSPGASSA